MSQPPGKILVIRGGAIGDFILTLPALAALREHFPRARLELLGYSRTAPLAQVGGLIDAFRGIEARALAGFFARDGTLADELQSYFQGFAIIISYLYDPEGIFHTNVARCSKAQFISAPHRPDEHAGLHATEVFLKPLERLAIFGADPVPRLRVEQASSLSPISVGQASSLSNKVEQASCLSLGRQKPLNRRDTCSTLALHPGSGGEQKNWPESGWAELIRRLMNGTEWNFLLVGGEAEGDRLTRLTGNLPETRVKLARDLPLVTLAGQLSRCRAFVGHDSGITHLAAALGLSGVVLWGPTKEAVWRPLGGRMKLLRSPGELAQLAVERIVEELITDNPSVGSA